MDNFNIYQINESDNNTLNNEANYKNIQKWHRLSQGPNSVFITTTADRTRKFIIHGSPAYLAPPPANIIINKLNTDKTESRTSPPLPPQI